VHKVLCTPAAGDPASGSAAARLDGSPRAKRLALAVHTASAASTARARPTPRRAAYGRGKIHPRPAMSDDSPLARDLRDAADRKPSPFPRLLMGLANARDARLAADSTSDYAYEDAYFDAARKLSATAKVGLRVDPDVLPILYLYRHFIELVLKSCIRHLNVHVYAHHGRAAVLKPPEHHKLVALLRDLRQLHEKVASFLRDTAPLPSKQAQAFIQELAAVDEGFTFRYLRDKKGERMITEDLRINLDVLDAGMLHIHRELMAYRDMVEISTEAYDWSDADW
jgi:hypothetical protein